jgi:excisionase family DNA binding protein
MRLPHIADAQDELTSGQVARELGVPYSTIYLWIVSALLPARRVGNRYLVRRSDLETLRAHHPRFRGAA